MGPLLLEVTTNTPIDYLPVVLQLVVAIGFVAFMLAATHLLGPKRPTTGKLINFESGIPSVGNARQPMAIKYFLVAILFVLFDVEVIFLYPWAVNFRGLGMDGFLQMIVFMAMLMLGFYYVIKKGILNWE